MFKNDLITQNYVPYFYMLRKLFSLGVTTRKQSLLWSGRDALVVKFQNITQIKYIISYFEIY